MMDYYEDLSGWQSIDDDLRQYERDQELMYGDGPDWSATDEEGEQGDD